MSVPASLDWYASCVSWTHINRKYELETFNTFLESKINLEDNSDNSFRKCYGILSALYLTGTRIQKKEDPASDILVLLCWGVSENIYFK